MSAPETFDREITLPFRIGFEHRENDEIELLEITLNPEDLNCKTLNIRRFTQEQRRRLRAACLDFHRDLEREIKSERQASGAETRAHFRREP